MRRTGFNQKPHSPFSSLTRTSTLKRQKAIVSRIKRATVAEGSKYLAACRGEECYLRVPGVCCSIGWAHESVVDCHSNQSKHGKGWALKAKHEYTVPGCGPCHYWLDFGRAPRAVKVATWDRAYEEWEPVRARKMGEANCQ
ncbi:hypothetical protein X947_6320 [Burkholderia pseudomallei MSHR7334]|uniref:DUF1364 family protein n=1 Tax=Burkholderia pseudomallei TaxID=28450 RepID=UPI000531C240|nr:DUF1364 family protein [Burkholderia pseudomallei]KGS86717.1 hypothetical protein X947_6320 [Burkholderia pseudomallei MSHR7334]